MKVIARTWQRGLVGKLIVGVAGITACCCATSFLAVISPSRPQSSAEPTPLSFTLSAGTLVAPTAAPTNEPAPTTTQTPTEAPTALPTEAPTAVPTDPPTPEPAAAPTALAAPIVTAADQVNVRAGPGINYPAVGLLGAGQTAPIIGKSADGTWWQIELAGALGWVRGDIVTAAGPIEAVAIVEAPAPPEPAVEAQPTAEPAAAAPVGPTRDPRNPGYVWNWGAGTQDGSICVCGGPDLNCRDFSSWEQAQACFDKCGGNNVFGLDNNKNNIVCENPAD